ncbi:AAA family ATPase [Aureisphaera galaxeae]|uniref:AAA family ATPase n=1 Tax=Aureisphaera galaxeae TaxID=1538023 RepID=UPI002350DEFB|nr:AAA family ATPase [Aureisphaera galaxeae]MDC8004864.1 AAA family ATPase [Aureisphaera galaxeae]
MNTRKYHKATDQFFSKLPEEQKAHFFKGKSINPLSILKISDAFPTLRIKDEDLLVLYSQKSSMDALDFILTTHHLHIASEKIPLQQSLLTHPNLGVLPKEHMALLASLLDDLLLTKKDEKKDLEYFTNKFKDFVNKKESANQDFDIDYEFLQILKAEGDKIQNLAEDLNNNKRFSNTINAIVQKSDDAMEFQAEHVILQDIIKLFNAIYPLSDKSNEESDSKIKFLLAFLFEKMQGNDIISTLSIERINTFVQSEKFDENIEIIKNASLFDLGPDYKNEFLMPSLLKRLDSPHFANSTAFLYRIGSLIAKADGTISEEETELLKKIQDKLAHPKQKIEGVKQTEINEDETLDDVMDELNELIGLDNIKKAVGELSNFLKVQKIREEKGLKNVNNSLHSVFMGPPGTGKTTVARLVSRIYRHLGYLEKGHLVETDRTGMVAGYVGQTALKVEEVVKASIDGVLFIDEAYALAKDNKKDFGTEAIEVLLKKMEDHRKELVVIVAGYPDEMEDFIESNPGLQSRFNRYFTFDHYKPKELVAIFELFCTKNDFALNQEAKEKLEFIFDKLYEKRHKSFGNARAARNLFEKIIEYHANRIVSITPITEELLKTIVEEDIPPVNKTVEEYLRFQEDEEEEV